MHLLSDVQSSIDQILHLYRFLVVFGAMEGEILGDNLIGKGRRSKRQRQVIGEKMGSSSSSSEDLRTVEEDLEAAKCLILLARGVSEHRIEMISNGGVYECKSCNRSFNSYQALGGHRASHKKLKITVEEEPVYDRSCHLGPPPAKNRVHQCVICTAEFTSGQALGGHMRRHRVSNSLMKTIPGATITAGAKPDGVTLSLLSPARVEKEEAGNETSRSDDGFQCLLDLNLPPASSSEEEIRETKLSLGPGQPKHLQGSGLVLSDPALVMN